MSVWQFMAAVDGYIEAKDPKSGDRLTDAEADDLWEWVKG